jgi:hypothetical protein
MTNEQKGWEIIKGMHISGPWQEHIVHNAVISAMNWKDENAVTPWVDINVRYPDDGQRVLTWNNRYGEVRTQVFNMEYECWDTEDGDDFEFKLNATTKDGTLIVRYWQPLPKKPLPVMPTSEPNVTEK